MAMKTLDDLAAAVLAMPAATSPEISQVSEALYRDLHRSLPPRDVMRDLSYGPDGRHRIDLHLPSIAGADRPVLLFVHGGGYTRGDKSKPGLFYYDNIGAWAARHGLVGAVMTYRLAPEHVWPSGAQDIGAAVAWLAREATRFGIDARGLFLMGHSAGAAHAGGYLAGHGGQQGGDLGLAGCILISGTYDLVNGAANKVYFGDDASQYAQRSSIEALARSETPLLLGIAQADPAPLQKQFVLVQRAFLDQGRPLPELVYAAGHNHYTVAHHLGTEDTRVAERVLRFIFDRAHHQETATS
jgi:acetyl esterase/lipase